MPACVETAFDRSSGACDPKLGIGGLSVVTGCLDLAARKLSVDFAGRKTRLEDVAVPVSARGGGVSCLTKVAIGRAGPCAAALDIETGLSDADVTAMMLGAVASTFGVSMTGESPCPSESFEMGGRGGRAMFGGRLVDG